MINSIRFLTQLCVVVALFSPIHLSVAAETAKPAAIPSPSPSIPTDDIHKAAKDVITELIFDASGSMKAQIEQRTKLYQAKRVMKSYMIETNSEHLITGLRVYGLKKGTCKDSYLVYKFGQKTFDGIQRAVQAINPKHYGKTPLAYSLELAAKDLSKFKGKPTRIVVLTDGVDTCGGDPCKTAAKIRKKYDTKIFVIGYTLNDHDRQQLQCIGKASGGGFSSANNLNSLSNAMQSLASIGPKNVFVHSPDPLGTSTAYEILPEGKKKYVAQFVSKYGTYLKPGKTYKVVVEIQPNYVFRDVVLRKGERKTLVVRGSGTVDITFGQRLWDISLLDARGKVVKKFASDTPTQVAAGSYHVKAVAAPFATAQIDDIKVFPNGRHTEPIKGYGAVVVYPNPEEGTGPFGYYIFDAKRKVDIGSFLTGIPVVLPNSKYTVKSVGDAVLKNLVPQRGRILRFQLPKPGTTRVLNSDNEAHSKHRLPVSKRRP